MEFLGIIGFLGFLIFLVLGIISLFKKNGKAKKNFGIMAALFVLFIIGISNSSATEDGSRDKEEKTETDEIAEDGSDDEEQDESEEVKKEPTTVADVQNEIVKDMSFEDYKVAKEALNVESLENISIGNGNIGSVLKASDGFVVVDTDGERVLAVNTFSTMEEVNAYGEQQVAKAQEEKQKKLEASKIKVNGTGDTATDALELKSGFAIFDGKHTGASNFVVQLQDESGNDLELLVNEIGNYQGKTFATIPTDGNYYLNVQADGQWNYEISQFIPTEIPSSPTTLEGKGDDVVFVDMASGNHKLTFSHDGQSNFVVLLNGQNLLVNEIGNYNGSQRQQFKDDGAYGFVITADGNWTINIE